MEIRSLSSRCDAMFYVRLSYDGAWAPGQRRKLKVKIFDRQQGRCPLCGEAS